MAQMAKNLPAVQENWVQSLGQKDALEKEMATHFSILTWEIPWTEEPGGLQSVGPQRVTQHTYHPYNWSLPFTLHSNVLFCFSLTKKSE